MIANLFLTFLFVAATSLEIGKVAPDFTANDSEGHSHTLATMLRQGPVVLVFFPKAFTPGCTRELTAYQGRSKDIDNLGAQVVAISGDDAETLKRFKEELHAAYTFIPDHDGTLMKLYDVRQWPLTLAKRTTFVIDRGQRIVRIDHGDDALDVSQALNACSKTPPVEPRDAP